MKTKKQTITSTIVQFLIAVNSVLIMFGVTKFSGITEDTLYTIVSSIVMFVAWGIGLWKNHNFTEKACEAQGVLDQLKGKADDNVLVEDMTEKKVEDEQDI